jgi:hypothetical protein
MGLQALMQKMATSGPAAAAGDGDGKRKLEMDMSQLGQLQQ